MPHDRFYWASRAAEERNLANGASDPIVRQVHLRLMRLYEERIAAIGELINNKGAPHDS